MKRGFIWLLCVAFLMLPEARANTKTDSPSGILPLNLKNYSQSISEERKFFLMLGGAMRSGSRDPLLYQAHQAERALRNNPNDRKANETLCDAMHRTGYLAAAAKQCRDTLKIDPASALARVKIADIAWREKNDAPAAAQLLQNVLRDNPRYAPANLLLAEIAKSQGQDALASSQLQQALDSNPDASALVALAENQLEQKLTDAARASLLQALQLEPNNARALSLLGELFKGNGDYARALDFAQKAAAANANSAIIQYRLGTQLAEVKRDDEAMAAYRQALRADANFAPAIRALGLALARKNSPIEALDYLQQAQKLYPQDAIVQNELRRLYATMGQEHATAAAPIPPAPSPQDPRITAAQKLEQARDFASAQKIYERMIIDNPENPAGYYLLARMYYVTGDYGQTRRFNEISLERQKNYGPALALRSQLRCDANNPDAAARDFALAVQNGYVDEGRNLAQYQAAHCPALGNREGL